MPFDTPRWPDLDRRAGRGDWRDSSDPPADLRCRFARPRIRQALFRMRRVFLRAVVARARRPARAPPRYAPRAPDLRAGEGDNVAASLGPRPQAPRRLLTVSGTRRRRAIALRRQGSPAW